jgi:hypothetical protein
MGRPLNHKFFGDLNPDNVGGEGIASVTVGGVNNSSGYTTGDAVTFTAPQIAGGTTATGTIVATAGAIVSITITNSGSGYTSAPTVTAATGTLGTTTLTGVLTSGASARRNVIIPQVRIGGTNRTSGNDILKQTGSKRFKVKSQDGTAVCALVARTPAAAGEMAIVATDSQSNTYWVRKITKNKVELVQNTLVGATWDIADGDTAKWTITGSAAAPVAGGNPAQLDGPTVTDMGTVVLNNA